MKELATHFKLYFIFSLLLTALFACNPKMSKQLGNTKAQAAQDSVKTADTAIRYEVHLQGPPPIDSSGLQQPEAEEDTVEEMDCVRGQATPVIKKSVYPNAIFILLDSIRGLETVDLDNGDRLIIRNWGCEYYVLTFRFETSRFQADTTNLPFWFKKADLLMTGILSGIEAPIDIKKGTTELHNYMEEDAKNKYANIDLGEEIDYGDDIIRDYVTVDRIEKMSEKKYAVEISFVNGPL